MYEGSTNSFKKEGKLKYMEDYDEEAPSIPKYNLQISSDDKYKAGKQKRYMGNTCGFFYIKGEPLITIGPHWPLLMCTWGVMLGFGIFVYNVQLEGPMKTITLVVVLWQAFIYMLTGLKNPGIASALNPHDPSISLVEEYPNFCRACRVLRDKTTYHCEDCNVCIRGHDHHCPWTGKCIGKGNLYPFYAFLVSTILYLVFCMVTTSTS